MRKAIIISLSFIGLGVSAQLSEARQATCTQMFDTCFFSTTDQDEQRHCASNHVQCLQDGSWGNVAGPGYFRQKFKSDEQRSSGKSTAPAEARSGTIRDHRGDPAKTSTAGTPPPAGTPATIPVDSASGPVFRDHRPGGNAADMSGGTSVQTAKARR